MRNLFILFGIMLCTSCAQLPPSTIPNAPSKQAKAVVFAIDGTLTPKVFGITEARSDAANALYIYAMKGYKIIYLSTRVRWFSADILRWLKQHHFPDGSIHVPQTEKDRNHLYEFKKFILKDFKKRAGILSSDTEIHPWISKPMPQSESQRKMFSRFYARERLCANQATGRNV